MANKTLKVVLVAALLYGVGYYVWKKSKDKKDAIKEGEPTGGGGTQTGGGGTGTQTGGGGTGTPTGGGGTGEPQNTGDTPCLKCGAIRCGKGKIPKEVGECGCECVNEGIEIIESHPAPPFGCVYDENFNLICESFDIGSDVGQLPLGCYYDENRNVVCPKIDNTLPEGCYRNEYGNVVCVKPSKGEGVVDNPLEPKFEIIVETPIKPIKPTKNTLSDGDIVQSPTTYAIFKIEGAYKRYYSWDAWMLEKDQYKLKTVTDADLGQYVDGKPMPEKINVIDIGLEQPLGGGGMVVGNDGTGFGVADSSQVEGVGVINPRGIVSDNGKNVFSEM